MTNPKIATACDNSNTSKSPDKVTTGLWFLRLVVPAIALIVLSSTPSVSQSVLAVGANEDAVVHWPRLDFVIPFNVDVTGQAPREIQLEFSENGGKSWSLYSSGDVRTKQFHFQAKVDGEYQFRLKTLDSEGRRFDNPGEPLRVVVDTTKPEAKLMVDIDQRGVMQAEFEIADAALDPLSIQLAYQTETMSQWQEIPFESSQGRSPSAWLGSGSWSIPSGTRQLVVRLTAKDKAGNPIELTRLPQLPRSAAANGSLQLASGKYQDARNASRSAATAPVGSGLPELSLESLPKVEVIGAPRLENSDRAASPENQMANRSDGRKSKLPVRTLSDEEFEHFKSQTPISLTAKRTERSLFVQEDIVPSATPSASLEIEPKTTRIPGQSPFHRDIKRLYSNSKAFSLDYNIDNDPDAPISIVELWGTSDEGQTWQLWGQDPDRASPFDIEVEAEGLFGFRMVIVGTNGLASNRPRNGDNADAWIHVDIVPPQAKIVSALYGKGKESGSMIIEYRANDDFFTDRPITLSYSQTPTGPWSTIASGVRNNGRYVWPADPSLPTSIYLRIEAYDAAGNVCINQLDLPIDVEGIAPRGRIQGFRPIK